MPPHTAESPLAPTDSAVSHIGLGVRLETMVALLRCISQSKPHSADVRSSGLATWLQIRITSLEDELASTQRDQQIPTEELRRPWSKDVKICAEITNIDHTIIHLHRPPPHDGDGLKDKCTLWLLYLVTWFPFGETVLGSSRTFKECSLDGGTMSLRDGLSDFVAFPQLLFTLCFLLWLFAAMPSWALSPSGTVGQSKPSSLICLLP